AIGPMLGHAAVLQPEVLQSQLEQSLSCTLPFHTKRRSDGDLEYLLKTYAVSFNQLVKMHAETMKFLEVVCQTNLEFRSEGTVNENARDEILGKELSDMVSGCLLPPLPPDEAFTAYLTSLPFEHAEARLHEELN